MFHMQLRQFPHNHCQFNLTYEELRSLAESWVRGQPLALGERRWSPHQAKLTIIEGPQVPMQQLSMGRGWRHAERQGEDVTRSVLEAASAFAASVPATPTSATADAAGARVPSADRYALGTGQHAEAPGSLASAVPSLLGGGARAEALLAAWWDTARRFPDRSPSECLALAEQRLHDQRGPIGRYACDG